MDSVKLSPPWIEYFNKLNALFGKDPDIELDFDDDDYEIKMYVEDDDKADALMRLLPMVVNFGNVDLKITVIPANSDFNVSKAELIKRAFEGNPAFAWAVDIQALYNQPIHYIMFKNEVVQFFNDQLDDPNGNLTTLYQDLAKELLGESEGVHFGTDDPTKPHPEEGIADYECDYDDNGRG